MKLSSPAVITAAILGVSGLVAQSTSPIAATTSNATSPVAHVYVMYHPNPNANPPQPEIAGYSADSAGRLTPIPGSPWSGIPYATTGTYFFALDEKLQNVTTYKVSSDGALTKVENYDLANRAPSGCEQSETFYNLTLDHTGADLYAPGDSTANDCTNNYIVQSYKINKDTGALTYLGSVDDLNLNFGFPLSFTSTNLYAYGGSSEGISALQRQSSGLLVKGPNTSPQPVGAPAGVTYMAQNTAADPANHVAVVLNPLKTGANAVLAAYTVSSNGDLTTTNTVDQMPVLWQRGTTYYYTALSLQMSPSGLLIAEADSSAGVRVFHFNGAKPITPYATLVTDKGVGSLRWDNANHLYAVGTNKLYVFTVTPTGWSQAPGSPYPLNDSGPTLVVRSLTSQ